MSRIESSVIAKIEARARAGLSKYGVSMERADLSVLDWLRHAQEEAMDLAVYLERLIQDYEALRAELAAYRHWDSIMIRDEVDRWVSLRGRVEESLRRGVDAPVAPV